MTGVPIRGGVRIRGDGVAARCCAYLLKDAGIAVSVEPAARPRVPAIMIGEAAQHLICDLFGEPDLFRGLPRIRQRIVSWGAHPKPAALDHAAIVISEEALLGRLPALPEPAAVIDPAWTVYCAIPRPAVVREERFGSRIACAMPVKLTGTAEPEACWIESLADGWLFLIANSPGSGWLLAAGREPEALLAQSGLIRRRVAHADAPTARFAAAPRLIAPLAGPGWIACGTAALSFDPLCGDGAAHAVREAILAAALIKAAARGDPIDALLSHYQARLTAGFQRHLIHAREYYAAGHPGPWWEAEAESLGRGIEWCASELRAHGDFRYRLEGLDLRPCFRPK